jgi:hypothetical protein
MQDSLRLTALGYWCNTRDNPMAEDRVAVFRGEPMHDEDLDMSAAELVPLPHPRSMVDPARHSLDRPRIVRYLRLGWTFASYEGFSYCRFGCTRDDGQGCRDLTDGHWVWPEGLAHYVERHDVGLPDVFLDGLRSQNWQMPLAERVSVRVQRFRELRSRLERVGKVRGMWDLFDWSVWIAWAEACKRGKPA